MPQWQQQQGPQRTGLLTERMACPGTMATSGDQLPVDGPRNKAVPGDQFQEMRRESWQGPLTPRGLYALICLLLALSTSCLDRAPEKPRGEREFPGATVYSSPALGIDFQFINNMIYVWAVRPGGIAENAGVKRGDSVVKINEIELVSEPEMRRAIRDMGPGTNVLVVITGGSRAEVLLDCPLCVAGERKLLN